MSLPENNEGYEPQIKKFKSSELEEKDGFAIQSNHEHKKQTEENVGITEYVENLPPIFGILKQKFSDFIVHEVNEENKIIRLTNLDIPPMKKMECDESVLKDNIQESLKSLNDGEMQDSVKIPIDNLDKKDRKLIHCTIKSLFPKLDSNTVEENESKFIRVTLKSKQAIQRNEWPTNRDKYVYFVLYKENKDTMNAINVISSKLRVNPSLFGYAGTKDRRAKTSQVISVKQVSPAKLIGLNKSLRQMKIGNIEFKKTPLRLGDLYGNNFTIILREVKSEWNIIEKSVNSLKDRGFINYFGMQRFGTSDIPTQLIGKALLKCNWKEAIDLILMPRTGETKDLEECRKIWQNTQDADKAYSALPPFMRSSIEGQLLFGLKQHLKNDLVGALNSLPRNTRLMYVHSYQSYVWNKTVSYRIKKFGFNPIVGDLVCSFKDMEQGHKNCHKSKNCIQIVSNEDLDSDKYSIYDVVLPLPGYDIKYPANEIKDFLKNALSEDSLDIDNMRMKVKDYSLPGSYRKIMIKPKNVEWSIHQYNEPTDCLELSDVEILEGISIPENIADGKNTALKVNFTLPSSCYATMALREIMKIDTSSNYQKTLGSCD